MVELRPPVYGYSAYISSLVLGDGANGLRAPAVFFGLISIIALYLIVYEITKDRRVALLTAFFLAIIPWHIHYSRVGWEPASFLPFLLWATYFFIYGLNKNKKYIIALSFLLFTLTIYTYQAAPLYSFIFLASLVLLNYRYFINEKKLFAICVALSIVLIIPYIWTVMNEISMYYRASRISTFYGGINTDSLSLFAHNYISHFAPSFLFISGDHNPRHGADTGLIYWVMLPFIILGAYGLLRSQISRKYKIFLSVWLFSYPLAGALTNDGVPHATRSLIGAPVYCILSGFGLVYACDSIKKLSQRRVAAGALLVFVIAISIFSLFRFWVVYFNEYPKVSYQYWEYGQKEVFAFIKSSQDKYKRACVQNLHYANEVQLIAYYLGDTHLEIIKDIDNPMCRESGTILVSQSGIWIRTPGARLTETVKAPNGDSLYTIHLIR